MVIFSPGGVSLSKRIDDFGIISLMYHRFEENKYPSTNIRLEDFKTHLKIIKENQINFNFEVVDSQKFYVERKMTYKNFVTILRQICKYHNIPFTTNIKYLGIVLSS